MSDVPPAKPYPNPQAALYKGDGWLELGRSAGGHSITGSKIDGEPGAARILLVGGVHGDETEGVRFMTAFCDEFVGAQTSELAHLNLLVIPVLNVDGFLGYARQNQNGVDLNRNLPTKDWTAEHTEPKYFPGEAAGSEPENQVLMNAIDEFRPAFIVSFHSWKPMININGEAMPFAQKMVEKIDMKIVGDIGYPTPGSLGTYAGWERDIPTITFEFERGMNLDSVYSLARDGLLNSFTIL